MKNCSNCGEEFEAGDGYPENDWECCCNYECWIGLTGEGD